MEAGNPLLDDYVLGLAGGERPRVCFLPSASGDADHYLVRFYQAFSSDRCEPSHISLFRRGSGQDLREHLLSQDLIYVGGGSVISLLGVWEAHGVGAVLREAWEAGVILCGVSAGSLCWFAEGITALPRRPRAVPRARLPRVQQHRSLRHRERARGRLPRGPEGGHAAGIRVHRRRRPALRGGPPGEGRVLPPRGSRLPDALRARARDQERPSRVLPRGSGSRGRRPPAGAAAAVPVPPVLAAGRAAG